jgi:eukaryotic-like serine/threonine-protein kinase
VAPDVTANYEPLPGYRLIEHVGDGGYGEVWRAEAPGGLTKAIKFVFGQENERRATSELRALEKIRGLRHPFLLSLERIEAVDGRLLIVSELADESVRDRFEMYRQQGLPGIPRDELLSYLRDAADALDFINARHALQHLDVKPENLLLVAGHVKVADFGLVKNVQQTAASLVGGMTPLYSAPEVFRGVPSRRSDQYSLAILYQEMLTGTVPFTGSNAAELTFQHLHDEPDLSPLPSADRYVVSRALAKEPEHRYSTCLGFIEALRRAADGTPPEVTRESTPAASRGFTSHAGSRTEIFADDDAALWGANAESLLIELPPGKPIIELPPLEVEDEAGFRPTPALVLGVGGMAGRVMAHVRSHLTDQFDNASSLPSFQMLLLDTDPKALSEVTLRKAAGLKPEETLSLPLHRPQHYRNHSEQLLQWLNRRWLYNIPKSMRTEGLRPLGRLALVDHARQTCQRIRMALSQAIDAEAIATSSHTTGRAFRDNAVRVYVVASISGGTGSGMAIDLGYAVRMTLHNLGITDAQIVGIMMHSTGSEPPHGELARVNAFSWLTEFHHFSQPNTAYPGDHSCGLPAQAPGVAPFDATYFIHLGESIETDSLDSDTQSVADYLLLDMLTPAQSFFDASRRKNSSKAGEPGSSETNLRSFGIYRKPSAPIHVRDELAQQVCWRVLAGWRDAGAGLQESGRRGHTDDAAALSVTDHGTEPVVQGAVHLIRRLQLEPAALAANAKTLLEAQLGSDATTFLSTWLSTPDVAAAGDERSRFAAMDRVFGAGGAVKAKHSVLGRPLAEIIRPLQEKIRGDVRRWTIGRIDDPLERLAGAQQALSWLEHHFQSVERAITQLARSTTDKLNELQLAVNQSSHALSQATENLLPQSIDERLSLYFRLRLDLLAFVAAGELIRSILLDLQGTRDDFAAFGRELVQMTASVSGDVATPVAANRSEYSAVVYAAQSRLPELAVAVDQRLEVDFLHDHGGLLETVLRGGHPRAQLALALQRFARHAVEDALSSADTLADALHDGHQGPTGELPLRSGLALAVPQSLQFGGTRRVLAVLPQDAAPNVDTELLAQALGTPVSRSVGFDNGFLLCVEAEQLSVPHVALDLVDNRRDCTDFAQRVHSRTDIAWTPLIVPSADVSAGAAEGSAALPPLPDPLVQQTQMIPSSTIEGV